MPEIEFNPFVAAMQPSATLAMTARAKALQDAGKPVIGLSAGEPDFDTPQPIIEAGAAAMRGGWTHYTQNTGLLELRQAIVRKLAGNGLDVTADQIVCSNGAKQSVAQAVLALVRPGDEVLIPAPYWVSYPEMVRLAGGTPRALLASAEAEYKITPDQLRRALTPQTRMLFLNSPSNPTGAVYSADELEALAVVLREHPHVWILSDEIYEHVIFDAVHVSIASLPGMAERTITVNGFSKGYAMTGWRLGYLAAPLPVAKTVSKIQSQFTSAPSTITQKAGVAALAMDHEPIQRMVDAFRERRDYVLARLDAIDGLHTPKPEGAFYLFPDVSAFLGSEAPSGRLIESAEELAFYLLEEYHVALVPGEGFGAPTGLRISYAASLDTLESALDRIEAGLEALQPMGE
jgi:aspartate/methionine/tyrosine aminotransferase